MEKGEAARAQARRVTKRKVRGRGSSARSRGRSSLCGRGDAATADGKDGNIMRSMECGGIERYTLGGSDVNTAGSSNDNTAGSSTGIIPGGSDANTTGSSTGSTPKTPRKKRRVAPLAKKSRNESRRIPVSLGSEDEFEEENDEEDCQLQVYPTHSLALQYGWMDSDEEEKPAECLSLVHNGGGDGSAPLPGSTFGERGGAKSIPTPSIESSRYIDNLTDSPSVIFNFGSHSLPNALPTEERSATLPVLGSEQVERLNLILPPLKPKPESPTDMFNFVWEPLPNNPIPMEARREPFSGPVTGPTMPVVSPIDSFVEIWNHTIMENIAEQTNKYAKQLIAHAMENELGVKSRLKNWKDTNVAELYVYFALILAMSVLNKIDITEYWQTTSSIFRTPGFSEVMSRNRFQLLSRCLHFVDNESLDASNLTSQEAKIFKIAPIITHLNERFQFLYNLGQNFTIDDSLTQWKDRLNIKQCGSNKAAPVGIKSYEICELQTGYLYKFEVCPGRDDEPVVGDLIPGYIPNLILRLVRGLEHRGHTLWMDKFYNSPALARVLKVLGFDVVGTLRTNSEHVPKEIHDLKVGKIPMQQGQMLGCTSGDVDLMVWKDRRNVATISTYHGLDFYYDVPERKRKPTLIRYYNVCMRGIDKKDQMLSLYPVVRRTRVWYKKLFKRMLNVSVLNAYIIYSKSEGSQKLSHRDFRSCLVDSLLDRFGIKATPPPPAPSTINTGPYSNHFTVPTGYVPGTKTRIRKYCVYCKLRCRSECVACNIGLHIDDCSQKYHEALRKK